MTKPALPLEKTIEAAVVKFAKGRGFLVRKMNGLGYAGWPDRMFIKWGKAFFIEFKRSGGKLSAGQRTCIDDLKFQGMRVYVVDNVTYGEDVIRGEDV